MNLTTLKNNLSAYISPNTNQLSLPAVNTLNSTDITNLIENAIPGNTASPPDKMSLVIDDFQLTSQTDKTLVYQGTFNLNQQTLRAVATFYLVNSATDGTPELTLAIFQNASQWNFSQAFPKLAGELIDALFFDNAVFVIESYTSDGSNQYPNVVQGFNFIGTLRNDSAPIAPIDWLISASSAPVLNGTFTNVADLTQAPDMNLQTAALPSTISLGAVNVSVVISVTATTTTTDGTSTLETAAALITTIQLGSAIAIPIIMQLWESPPAIITFDLDLEHLDPTKLLLTGLSDLSSLVSGGDLNSLIPSEYPLGNHFKITNFSIAISPESKEIVSLYIGVALADLSWAIIPPNIIVLDDISVSFLIPDPLQPSLSNIAAKFAATFTIVGDFDIVMMISLPNLTIQGFLPPGNTIPVIQVIKHFVGDLPLPNDALTITELNMLAQPTSKSYAFSATIDTVSDEYPKGWTIPLGVTELSLEQVSLNIVYDQTALSGEFDALINFLDTDFILTAQKPDGGGGWIFSGAMAPGEKLPLVNIVKMFLPSSWNLTIPSELQNLDITELAASFNTQDNTYSFSAAIQWQLNLIENHPFEIDASFSLQSARANPQATPTYSGYVQGEFKVNDLDVKVSYQFQSNNTTLSFSINFRGTTLSCTLTSKTVDQTTQKILTVSIGNLNVGEMIEYLVGLVEHKSDFKLSAPWDVLNDIALKNLSLEINLTTKDVSIAYTPSSPIDLLIIKLSFIKLTYSKKLGQGTVDIELGGDFLGTTYDQNNPLKWDLLNDQPPATPGAGAALLDMEYLGIGQHIAIDTTGLDNVTAVINALEQMLQPVDDASKNPLAQLKGLSFSQNSNWLIGTKFTVMGTVTLAVVFNDPQVYGLLIALGGAKAGSFGGLQFEILYKKVTDTIGVYHIELKLPDAMRHLEFGEVSVTLPIIVIDIYTNGNFRIDFGFPWNNDFSRSFSVQVFPFVGYGGFYFALLNGDTSTRVPKITNGNFNPVIEFGIGLSLGVGKTIDEGVLSAGASLTVQGILQGVIGWFNPNDKAVPSDRYYWIQGTISIVGKVYGTVNFVIIQVSISIVAYASATLTIESYKPILISLSAGVSVEASVKILFIRIHFKFSMTLNLSFTIGHTQPTPWAIAGSDGNQQALQPQMLARAVMRKGLAAQIATTPVTLNWQPVNVFGNQTFNLAMALVPAFTVAIPECSSSTNTTPQVQAVMLPFVENSLPLNLTSSKDTRKVLRDDASELPFNRLVHGVLAWTINALTQNLNTTIAATDLQNIYNALTAPDAEQTVFAQPGVTIYQNLSAFIGKNFTFQVTGSADSSQAEISATIFPMIPDLSMIAGTNATVNFNSQTMVDEQYQTNLSNYFQERLANAESNVAQDPFQNNGGQQTAEQPTGSAPQSLATVIFRDYFFMIAKSAVQAAIDALNAYQYQVQPGDSLDGMVKNLSYATTATSIAFANQDVALNTKTTLTNLGIQYTDGGQRIVKYQIKSGDTLAKIAANFNGNTGIVAQNGANDSIFQLNAIVNYPATTYTTQTGDTLDFIAAYYLVRNLESPDARDLRWFTQLIIDSNNTIDFRNPLTAGAQLQIPQLTINAQGIVVVGNNTAYTVQSGDTLANIAATHFAIPVANQIDPLFGWLRQVILELSQSSNPNVDFTQPLPVGTVLTIPTVVLTDEGVVQQPASQNFTYTSRAGDTLDLVAGYFLLTELEPSQLTAIENNIKAANSTLSPLPATINIPQLQHQIAPSDSFNILGNLFGAAVDVATANNQSTSLLAPLAILDIANVSHPIAEGETFAKIAALYNFNLEELAEMVETTPDVFVPTTTTLTIAGLQAIDIQTLLSYLIANGDFNNMAAMVSRFMLHGMRIPNPQTANDFKLTIQHFKDQIAESTSLCPLYQMTGQQFAVPSTITNEFDITFQNTGQAEWVEFMPTGTYTLANQMTLAEIAAAVGVPAPQIVALNPNVNFANPVAQGTTLTVPANEIVIKLTSATTGDYPSTTFSPDISTGPERMPLLQDVPVRYTLDKNFIWQVSETSLFPNQSGNAGQPTVWLLPDTLIAKVEGLTNPAPFDLISGSYVNSPVMQTNPVQNYYWATAIQLNVSRIQSQTTNAYLPNTYLWVGADQTGNDLLREIYNYLTNPSTKDSATLALLYQPNASSANNNGYASDVLDLTNTYILKTNLSTETHSPVGESLENIAMLKTGIPDSGDYYANFNDATDVLKFLWEGSIVGTGGFYINYASQSGAGLPDSVFANGNTATLWLVVLLASQSNAASPSRTLYAFNNSAVIGDNIDASKVNVFAEISDGSDTAPYTTVTAGNIGFQLTRPNPEQNPESPEQLTQSLYNLLGFEIVGDILFSDSGEMPPVGPVQPDPTQTGGLPLPANQSTDDTVWDFQQVVPIYKFAQLNNVPVASGLPDAASNPYAGITKVASGDANQLGAATFSFAFQDIYGNRTPPDKPIANLQIPVGYFDTIIGLSQWAGIASSYQFTSQNNAPLLNVEIGLDVSKYLPIPGNPFATAVYSASAHQEKYRQLYYQVQQKQVVGQTQNYDLTFYLSTTMSQTSPTVLPTRYAIAQRNALTNFINSAYLFLSTAMWLQQYNHSIGGSDTFAAIAEIYFGSKAGDDAATLEALAAANQNTDANSFFASTIQIPVFYIVRQGDTLTTIQTATGIQALPMVTQNQGAVLNTATVIALPNRTSALQFAEASDNTFASVAKNNFASVAGLACANATATNLLATNITYTYQGLSIQTGATDPNTGKVIATLQDLANYFNAQLQGQNLDVEVADVAVANQNLQGVFVESATININDYVIQQGDSVQSILAEFAAFPQITLAQIVSLNATVANFFTAGDALYEKSNAAPLSDGETLATIASDNYITLQQLAVANAVTALKTGATLAIPSLVTIDSAKGPFYSFYEASGNEKLSDIIALYDESVADLANANQNLTGIFASGKSITLSNITVPIGDYDTFNTLLAAFAAKGLQMSLADFATQIESLPGLIAANAFLVCNLPQVKAATTTTPVVTQSLAEIISAYQLTSLNDLGMVNSTLQGFLQAGVTVYPNQTEFTKQGIHLVTNANDTLVSLITRFNLESGVTTTIDDLVIANQTINTLVAPNAPFLLPPNAAVINQPITAAYPDIIFPVDVKLEMQRDADLIDPEFKTTPPNDYVDVTGVALDRSTIAPRSSASDGQALNLGDFALAFETQAFVGLKIATGQQDVEGQNANSAPPLFAVNFSANGFSEFEIQNQSPGFYAIKPLATELISRSNIPIQDYSQGQLQPATPKNFQAVDLDIWVSDFLAAVDNFLAPEFAVPAYGLDPQHAAYTGVVAAKANLAEALQNSVDYILNVNAPVPNDPALKAAQEALYQQLLINLSNGYAIDSIIQYPVSVQSPFADPDTAPRLSGNPNVMMYTTGASDVIATIAQAFNVSEQYLAGVIDDLTRILNKAATVSLNGQSATIQQIADAMQTPIDLVTLQTIAAYYKTDVENLAANLQVTAGGGLFAPGIVINIAQISKAIAASDTFDSLAEYFNASVKEVALANENLPDIFSVSSISVNNQTVPVVAGDTLYKVGQKFNPPMDAETLASDLATQSGLLNTHTTVYAVQVIPDFTLSTSKAPLSNSGSLLNFMFNSKSIAQYKKLFLDLNYVMNEMEYDIQSGAANIGDYQASSWLSFIIPIDSTVSELKNINSYIGQVEVPLPLRSYPTPPSLISQTGESEYPQAQSVDEAKMWNYAMTYVRQDAAQDTDYLSVTFNSAPQSAMARGVLLTDVNDAAQCFETLFNALAQFSSVYPVLKTDLAQLAGWKPGTQNGTALAAMNIFNQLITAVANAWLAYTNASQSGGLLDAAQGLTQQTYNFSLESLLASDGSGYLASLVVTPFANQPAMFPSKIFVYTTDKVTGNVVIYQLPDDGGTTVRVYSYPDGESSVNQVAAFGQVKQVVEFDGLDIVMTENAWGGVYVSRNQNLVSFAATNPAFIYQTPLVRFSNMMTPLIRNTSCILINQGDDLAASLNQVFKDLFSADTSGNSHNIKLTCQYGYQLVASTTSSNPCDNSGAGLTSLISKLPVLFVPLYAYNLNDPDFVATLVTTITALTSGASSTGGLLIFEIGLFSSLDAALTQPLLDMLNLVFQVNANR
ncbi:MAG: LysM peptidoglycan-binding domain-containing protein [Acidobacteriota bacterium]